MYAAGGDRYDVRQSGRHIQLTELVVLSPGDYRAVRFQGQAVVADRPGRDGDYVGQSGREICCWV